MTKKEQIKEFLFDLKKSDLDYYEIIKKWEKIYKELKEKE